MICLRLRAGPLLSVIISASKRLLNCLPGNDKALFIDSPKLAPIVECMNAADRTTTLAAATAGEGRWLQARARAVPLPHPAGGGAQHHGMQSGAG